MRRGLSVILVLLLVLRGLLGDAMAMGTAPVDAPTVAAVHHHAPTVSQHETASQGMSSHGENHADPASHDPVAAATDACSAQDSDWSHEHGTTCSACGICHSALFTPDLLAQPLLRHPSTLRPLGGTRFASAPAALDIKPPIS